MTYTVHCGLKGGLRLTNMGADGAAHVTLKEGVNPGVDGAFWERWEAENQDFGPYVSGLLTGVAEAAEASQTDSPAKAPSYRKK